MSAIIGKRIWLASDGETAVLEGDPQASVLLCGIADRVSDQLIERHSLAQFMDIEGGTKELTGGAEDKEQTAGAEDKGVKVPAETRRVRTPRTSTKK